MPWFTEYFPTVVSPFLYTVIKKGRSDMEMSATQPLCQSNYDAHEICVWGTQWRPPITYSPRHLRHTSPWRFSAVFFSLPIAISLFLFASCVQQTFCVKMVVEILIIYGLRLRLASTTGGKMKVAFLVSENRRLTLLLTTLAVHVGCDH